MLRKYENAQIYIIVTFFIRLKWFLKLDVDLLKITTYIISDTNAVYSLSPLK